jgi:hypothetical protein
VYSVGELEGKGLEELQMTQNPEKHPTHPTHLLSATFLPVDIGCKIEVTCVCCRKQ